MSSLRIQLGQAIRRLREHAGHTQESFADRIGVHRNYMGTVERGETNITLERLEQIAKGLKVEVVDLFREAQKG